MWVPQDWAHPHGPKIPLLVADLPATATTHPAAPLFILAGWGGSAIGDVNWAVQAFGRLNQRMDLVFAVQRGTQYSWPQTCPGLMQAGPGLRAAVDRCLASANRDPRHDTTAAAARDLDQVRKALGYNKINLYGASYGVSMGLAYLQRYGAHVRTAVFYSGSLLDVPLWQLTPLHAQQSFDQLARRCAAAPACARAYHPAADLATVVNRLRAHPARVTVTGPSGKKQTLTITLTAFLNAVIDNYLSSPDTSVLLPKDLHAFAHGQWAKVITERRLASQIPSGPTQLQEITIRCGDAWAAMNPAKIAQQARLSLFTPQMAATAAWQQQLCAPAPWATNALHSRPHRNAYFRALHLRAEPSPQLTALHQAARAAWALEPPALQAAPEPALHRHRRGTQTCHHRRARHPAAADHSHRDGRTLGRPPSRGSQLAPPCPGAILQACVRKIYAAAANRRGDGKER